MTNRETTVDWRTAAKRMWGDDWIAPLADVLQVSRRTVERWRSGRIPIPEAIARDLASLPDLGQASRSYGSILRRLSTGASVSDIEADIANRRTALLKIISDRGKYQTIGALSVGY